ncbi:DUF305 domain-containing protein [Cellulomonas sp. 73-145]|uniref:DUF305 domain-containing protein n=1 Tax=Cellulomonas sp. 73-145 TaxID=1895739 RepID=UPI000A92FCAB|nr:DUF305 domain-containing protein [Cellulomonas sp. 73-145]
MTDRLIARRSSRTRALVAVGVVSLVALLSACSQAAPASPSSMVSTSTASVSAQHNGADVEFAQMMIVHHQGALQMGQLAAQRGASADVRALGRRIVAAQAPEIEQMSGWLAAWGAPSPTTAAHAGMPGMEVGGMTQSDATGDLAGRSGTELDRQFLTLMVSHHQGAITMAQTEQRTGSSPAAVALAGEIVTAQTDEIARMHTMLGQLPSPSSELD